MLRLQSHFCLLIKEINEFRKTREKHKMTRIIRRVFGSWPTIVFTVLTKAPLLPVRSSSLFDCHARLRHILLVFFPSLRISWRVSRFSPWRQVTTFEPVVVMETTGPASRRRNSRITHILKSARCYDVMLGRYYHIRSEKPCRLLLHLHTIHRRLMRHVVEIARYTSGIILSILKIKIFFFKSTRRLSHTPANPLTSSPVCHDGVSPR